MIETSRKVGTHTVLKRKADLESNADRARLLTLASVRFGVHRKQLGVRADTIAGGRAPHIEGTSCRAPPQASQSEGQRHLRTMAPNLSLSSVLIRSAQ